MGKRGYWTKEQNKSETTKSGLLEPERLRGHYGHYAVTTVTMRSLRSLRGHHADTTPSKRATRSRLRKRSTSLQNGLFDQDIVAVDLEGSDFINASNLIHYTANRFKFDSIKRKMVSTMLYVFRNNVQRSASNRAISGMKPGSNRNETGQQSERNRAATGMKPGSTRNGLGVGSE